MSIHTFHSMGTVISVRVPDADAATDARRNALDRAVSDAQAAFDRLDERFSLYREESEASRIARGELSLASSSEEMREAYAESLEWRSRTSGAFTPHRPDGVIDLSGTIKAVGIQRAAEALHALGFDRFLLNAGGDILASGEPADGWVAGIIDPADRSQVLSAVHLTEGLPAMATSGSAERGEHIWMRSETEETFAQVTVIAADILTADVLATAIISGGQTALDDATAQFRIAVLTVDVEGNLRGNELFRSLIAR